MSHIVNFKIEGLAGRKGTYEQALNRDVNIFFGVNGGGKTSLLKILHSAMTGNADMLKAVPFGRAEVSIYSQARQKVFRRSLDKTVFKPTIDPHVILPGIESSEIQYGTLPSMAWNVHSGVLWPGGYASAVRWMSPDEESDKERASWRHSYLPTSRLYLSGEPATPMDLPSGVGQGLSEEQLDRYFKRAMDTLWLQYSADILSAVRKAQETGLARLLRNILNPAEGSKSKNELAEVNPQVAYQRVESFLKRQGSSRALGSFESFRKRYRREHRLRSVVAEIDAVEQGIEKAMAPRLQLEQLIRAMFSGNKSISFTDRAIRVKTDQNEEIGLEALSSGESIFLDYSLNYC